MTGIRGAKKQFSVFVAKSRLSSAIIFVINHNRGWVKTLS
jgi:hypothetical protein